MKRRVPVYHQLECNDCGLTCIQMLAHYYGRKYSLQSLKSFCELSRIGCTINDISTICDNIGLSSVAVSISLKDVFRMPLPSILYFNSGHFVILEKVDKRNNFHIIDPDGGRIRLTQDEILEKAFINERIICILVEPNDCFKSINPHLDKKKGSPLKKLTLEILCMHKKNFSITSILMLLAMSITWIMPLLFQRMIDEGITQNNTHLIWVLLIAQLLFNLGFVITNSISKLVLLKTGFSFGTNLIAKYLKKIVDLPISYFETRFSSDLIQRIGDQERVNNFIVDLLGGVILTFINLIVFSSILIYFNPIVFLVFTFGTLLSLAYTLLFSNKRKQIDYSLFAYESSRRNSIYDTIMGMQDIKINNNQAVRINDWSSFQEKINKYQLKSFYIETFFSEGIGFIDNIMDLAVTGICAFLVVNNQMTIGTMMTISFLLGQITSPVNQLLKFSKQLQHAKLSNDRVQEVSTHIKENNEQKSSISTESLNGDISFNHVDFNYPGVKRHTVLNNINLHIKKQQVTAIVGVSGSGKTTLLKLLMGFYSPSKGKILIGNDDISLINCYEWRQHCGVVMQNGYIFSGTIKENITLDEKNINIQLFEQAIKLACLDEFIDTMPMRENTKIGETGLPISGGQKQRILIARAIYKNPDYLFFDEATNSLDATNEKVIMNNLEHFYKGRTVIIVAHRLSTVKNADTIVVLDKGKIVEQGTHSELTERKGEYYKLVKNQLELGI